MAPLERAAIYLMGLNNPSALSALNSGASRNSKKA
jgi:hypothetical protein